MSIQFMKSVIEPSIDPCCDEWIPLEMGISWSGRCTALGRHGEW